MGNDFISSETPIKEEILETENESPKNTTLAEPEPINQKADGEAFEMGILLP